MGFSKQIKEDALVASARRCCICKEFLGRNIEIHHIIPKGKGGQDIFENAIPLCFDCHANAGHYNSKHPRGIKFSPTELRRHRNNWYKIIKNGSYSHNSINIVQQYFVCNSFDIVWEIVNGDFKNFPLNSIKVVENELFRYLQSASKFQHNNDRNLCIDGDFFDGIDNYLKIHKNVQITIQEWGQAAYYRTPTLNELNNHLFNIDFVANYMLRNNAEPKDIAQVEFIEYGCDYCNLEKYNLRPAKVVFLSILNTSDETIFLSSLSEINVPDGGFVNLENMSTKETKKTFNNLSLNSGEGLIIPVSIVLFPFESKNNVEEQLIYQHLDTEQFQDLRPIHEEELKEFPTIGPRNKVTNIEFQSSNSSNFIEVRDIDLNNLLLISRFWEFGSCPHLFIQYYDDGFWHYYDELFTSKPNIEHDIEIRFNKKPFKNSIKLKISEIEKEVTVIKEIFANGRLLDRNIILEKGQEYIITTNEIETLRIKGYYHLFEHISYIQNEALKKQKIHFHCVDMNSEIKEWNANKMYSA